MTSSDLNGTTVIAIVIIMVIIMKCLEAAVMVISMIGIKSNNNIDTESEGRRLEEGDM